jgi:hypothetical protein
MQVPGPGACKAEPKAGHREMARILRFSHNDRPYLSRTTGSSWASLAFLPSAC